MKVENKKRNGRIVFTTFFVTSLILAAGTFLFVSFVMPLYQISAQAVRSVLVRLLPILTGLLLAVISMIIAPPHIEKKRDREDELPIEEITSPLYVLPDEESRSDLGPYLDPAGPSVAQQKVVDEHLAHVEHTIPSSLDSVGAPPVILDAQQVLEMPIISGEEPAAVPETITEKTMEAVTEAPAETYTPAEATHLDRNILFASYPFPIEPGTPIAELLEPIGASEGVNESEYPELFAQTEDTFSDRLSAEIDSSESMQYSMSVARIATDGNKDVCDALSAISSITSIMYRDGNSFSLILPFHSFNQAGRTLAGLFSRVKKLYPDAILTCGYSTLGERNAVAEVLLEEMNTACDVAREHGGFAIIGYDPEIEEA